MGRPFLARGHLPRSGLHRRPSWALGDYAVLSARVEEGVYKSRKKDYDNPFRRATFRSDEEARAVMGDAETSPFVLRTRKDCAARRARAKGLLGAL